MQICVCIYIVFSVFRFDIWINLNQLKGQSLVGKYQNTFFSLCHQKLIKAVSLNSRSVKNALEGLEGRFSFSPKC